MAVQEALAALVSGARSASALTGEFKANNLSFGHFGPVLGTVAEVMFAALRGGVFRKSGFKVIFSQLKQSPCRIIKMRLKLKMPLEEVTDQEARFAYSCEVFCKLFCKAEVGRQKAWCNLPSDWDLGNLF